jgi:hypothetical protein
MAVHARLCSGGEAKAAIRPVEQGPPGSAAIPSTVWNAPVWYAASGLRRASRSVVWPPFFQDASSDNAGQTRTNIGEERSRGCSPAEREPTVTLQR